MRQVEGFTRGINLGGWLSQCDHTQETYENYIQEEDFKRISEWGLDHVRVPIDYQLVQDEEGQYLEEGFAHIDRAIQWSGKYNLNMILDLHCTYGFSFDDGVETAPFFYEEALQERFYRLWETLAERYSKYGDRLILELLNEVTKKEYSDNWNRIAGTCIARIRRIAPDIRILYGGYYNNSIDALDDLLMPPDKNTIYSFHCYEPLIFTHQGAYWAPGMDTSFRMSLNESYRKMNEYSEKYLSQVTVGFDGFDPDSTLTADYFGKYFSRAMEIAEERDVPLYCGEYGVIDLADSAEILAWYKIIHEAFEKYHISRAAWNYKGKDFGFIDDHMKPVLDEAIQYL